MDLRSLALLGYRQCIDLEILKRSRFHIMESVVHKTLPEHGLRYDTQSAVVGDYIIKDLSKFL